MQYNGAAIDTDYAVANPKGAGMRGVRAPLGAGDGGRLAIETFSGAIRIHRR